MTIDIYQSIPSRDLFIRGATTSTSGSMTAQKAPPRGRQEGTIKASPSLNSLTHRRKEVTRQEQQSLSSSGKRRLKKSVSFNEKVRGRKCLHIDDYTGREINACWYGPADFFSMRKDAKFEKNLMEAGLDPNKFKNGCTRGIERFTDSYKVRRDRERDAILDLVVQGQDKLSNPDLASAYEELSSSARARARAMGLKDSLDTFLS